ncbi:MAG: hypothetical protein HYZ42_13630 [Bacteroidetes bacterium]|nr:hypothetical protein [Bacteroidota bacterium]
MKVKIKIVKPDKHPEYIQKYIDGHAEVLKVVGITKVTSSNNDWVNDPNNYIIYVESEDGRALGGGRIQIFTPTQKLPMEGAIIEKDANITNVINEYKYYETAEFCGLWNSKEIAGFGIGSIILTRIGVAITSQLNLKCLFALCSPATLNNSRRVGFEVIKSLGNEGTFYYPKENLIATAIFLEDLENLPLAFEEDKMKMEKLRNNPICIEKERGPKGEIEIEYNLNCH